MLSRLGEQRYAHSWEGQAGEGQTGGGAAGGGPQLLSVWMQGPWLVRDPVSRAVLAMPLWPSRDD